MKNLTNHFANALIPQQAVVTYKNVGGGDDKFYAETYDFDPITFKPVGGHPFSINEAERLAKQLMASGKKKSSFLQSEGFLSENVLYVNPENGHVIWFTPASERGLFWTETTGVKNGKACVPPLVWSATKHYLRIHAVQSNKRPTPTTRLYRAPFFNTGSTGQVCMGSAGVGQALTKTTSLEAFMDTWEKYFFNSYFSHATGGDSLTTVNIVSLWNSLLVPDESGQLKPFPVNVLKPTQSTLSSLLK